jgi:enoyl-CoA hydratase/carnithine racemase
VPTSPKAARRSTTRRTRPATTHRDGGGQAVLRIFESQKPVIAAVNGPAVGVGVTMQLPMDVRIASTASKFGLVFARRGIVPEACSSWFLPRLVGISRAAEWIYTGRIFGPDEALAGGLVSRVVEPADLMRPPTRSPARSPTIRPRSRSPSPARSCGACWAPITRWKRTASTPSAIYEMGRSPDAREGVTSFLEKRPAHFTMRPSRDMPAVYPWWQPRPFKP